MLVLIPRCVMTQGSGKHRTATLGRIYAAFQMEAARSQNASMGDGRCGLAQCLQAFSHVQQEAEACVVCFSVFDGSGDLVSTSVS